jgi:hypothetical protein
MLTVDRTNKCVTQSNPNKPLDLTFPKCEQWLGAVLCTSAVTLPATKLYRSKSFRVPLTADCTSWNRSEAVRADTNFWDNLASGSDPASDRLHTVRLLWTMYNLLSSA